MDKPVGETLPKLDYSIISITSGGNLIRHCSYLLIAIAKSKLKVARQSLPNLGTE
jgi:hypothetical protein